MNVVEKEKIAQQIISCFKNGNKLMIVGNGGSAAMAQHMAAEFICKFEHDRKPLPAIALTTDTSILTAISNDYAFDQVFKRQVIALSKPGDILLTFSTSGNSNNIIYAQLASLFLDITLIDFPRRGNTTAKIQEYQLRAMHDVVRIVESAFL